MILGVDVDQTIVNTQTLWMEWLFKTFGINIKNGWEKQYDKDKYLTWWKNKNLYDELEPYPDAKKYLDLLSKKHKLWFITKCFDEHTESKLRFCHKFFNVDRFFNTGFNKAAIFDGIIHYMIDDRTNILSGFKQTKCFRINTTTEKLTDDFKLKSWKEIYNEIRSTKYG